MKKTYKILLFIQLILLAIFSLIIANTFTKNKILYKNTSSISIINKQNATFNYPIDKQIKILEENAQINKITLTKIVWISDNEMNLFTNDLTLNGFLDSSFSTELSSQHHFSNRGNTGLKKFDWIDNNETIRIYSLSSLNSLGIEGEYFIRNSEGQKLNNFMKSMSDETDLTITQNNYKSLSELQILNALFTQPILLATCLVTMLSLACALVFLYIQSSKKMAIQVLTGYSKGQLLRSLFKDSIKTLLFSILLSGILGFFYMYLKFKSLILYEIFFYVYLLGFFLIISVIMLITMIWIWYFHRKKNIYEFVKEKKQYDLLIITSKTFQLLFLFFFPFLLFTTISTLTSLNEFEKANSDWSETQGIYATSVQYVTSSYMERRPYEERIKEFYVKEIEFFSVLDASNYDVLSRGIPLYEANTRSKIDQLTSPDGRRITINPTYLSWNPIYDEGGERVDKSLLLFTENALNILIPDNLSEYTEEIKKSYSEDFLFQTYTIPHDIYEESPSLTSPEINIIYIKNGHNYLTNNSQIMGDENNTIIDPVVVVDTGNLDASQYLAWFSSSVFFKKEIGKTGYETIYPLLSKSNMTDLIQIVIPIYDQRAQEIKENREDLLAYFILILFLFIACILCFYYFMYSIFDKNRKKLFIKFYAGYSKGDIYASMYILWIVLDVLVVLLSSIFFDLGQIQTTVLVTLVIFVEINMILIMSKMNRMENMDDYFT